MRAVTELLDEHRGDLAKIKPMALLEKMGYQEVSGRHPVYERHAQALYRWKKVGEGKGRGEGQGCAQAPRAGTCTGGRR